MKKNNFPQRGFSEQEFELRLLKAQKIMNIYKLDGILITTPQNIRYFTGYDSQFWESPTRPWFVVVPLLGKPIAIVPEIGESEFKKTWLDEIKTWPSPRPEDEGISLVKSTACELKVRRKEAINIFTFSPHINGFFCFVTPDASKT